MLPDKQLKRRKIAIEHWRETSMELLYKDIDEPGLATLDGYSRRGGYEMLRKALSMEPADVLQEMLDSGVRGRGGAGFAMGKKMSFIPKGAMDKYLVCNADESEPGTFKDRELMQKNPHLLIEGIIIGAYAIGANKSFIFIRGEYSHQADVLDAAVAEARAAGYLGESILGSDHTIDLVVHRGAGAYICGEETALLDALEGKRGNPRLKPPFPAVQGLYQRPDADQQRRDADERPGHPADGRRGVRRDRHRDLDRHEGRLGVAATSSGPATTRSRSASRRARSSTTSPAARPRAARSRRGSPAARRSPVLPGTDEYLDLPYDFDSMAKAGSMLGSGAIIVDRRLDPDRRRRAQDGEVLPPRVVRQVHAVPRGHQLDREDARAHRQRRGDADGPRHHGLGPGADHRQLPVRARRRDGDADRLDDQALPRRVRGAHRGGARAQRPRRRDPAGQPRPPGRPVPAARPGDVEPTAAVA